MRLFFLITKLDYSGGPKMLAWVANGFAKNGHLVSICSIYSDVCGQELCDGVEFFSLNINQSNSWIRRNTTDMYMAIQKIRKEVNKRNPDFVVSFAYSVDVFYLLTALRDDQKMIISMRLDPYSEKSISSRIRFELMKKATGLVFQTSGAMKYYGDRVVKKSTVIPNPVTDRTLSYVNRVRPYEERDNIIVLPARLNIKQKRQDVMLRAFKIIHEKHSDFKLLFLGEGPDKTNLVELARHLGIYDNVIFYGAVNSAEEVVVNCKIMVLTSDFEGIPNSLIEAMSLGITVVATDCSPGGAKMLIKEGDNGFLLKCGDYEGIADRICYLIENPMMAQAMGEKAKEIRRLYSEKAVIDKWINFFEEIKRKEE